MKILVTATASFTAIVEIEVELESDVKVEELERACHQNLVDQVRKALPHVKLDVRTGQATGMLLRGHGHAAECPLAKALSSQTKGT